MKKFKTKEELTEEVDAAKKYYFSEPADLFDQIGIHLIKKYFLQQENPDISNASNEATTAEKFEGHQNYKELVNELNYPRGLEVSPKEKTLILNPDLFKAKDDVLKHLSTNKEYQGYEAISILAKTSKAQGGKFWEVVIKKKPFSYVNQVDTWYKQPFYGRVCNKNNLIYTNYFIYRNIAEEGDTPICVFDFVAKAFENMKKTFNTIGNTGLCCKLSKDSKHLAELKAVFGPSSTIRLEQKYIAHLEGVFASFMNKAGFDLRYSKRISDYDGFYKTFVDFVINNDITLTFTGFAESLGADIYDSYLAFDVKETNLENTDADKLEFLEDLNYPAYAYAARESGFAIDPNKPWRLIADVASDRFMDAIKDTIVDYLAEMKKLDVSAGDDKPGWFELIRIVRKTMDDNTEAIKNKLKDLKNTKALKADTDKLLEARGEKIEEATEALENEIEMYIGLLDTIRIYFKYDPGTITSIKKKQGLKGKTELIFNITKSYQPFFNKKEQEFKTLKELLKRSMKQLSFVFGVPTPTQHFYENIYYNVYDYQFFSYFPSKAIEFYSEYIETYPFSGKVLTSKNKAFSKFKKDVRPSRSLNDEKVVALKGSALYDIKYVKDYVRLRNSENNTQISLPQMQLLFNEISALYTAAENSSKDEKKFRSIKNRLIQLVELIFGTPSNQNLPIDTWLKNVKKNIFFLLKETWDNFEKPKLLLDRICLSPEGFLVPTLEPEACDAPFPGVPKKRIPGPPDKPPPFGSPWKPPGGDWDYDGWWKTKFNGIRDKTGPGGTGDKDPTTGETTHYVPWWWAKEEGACRVECQKKLYPAPGPTTGGDIAVASEEEQKKAASKMTECVLKCLDKKFKKKEVLFPCKNNKCAGGPHHKESCKSNLDCTPEKKALFGSCITLGGCSTEICKCPSADMDAWCALPCKNWSFDPAFQYKDPDCTKHSVSHKEMIPWNKNESGIYLGGASCVTDTPITQLPQKAPYIPVDEYRVELWRTKASSAVPYAQNVVTWRWTGIKSYDKAHCPPEKKTPCKGPDECEGFGVWTRCVHPQKYLPDYSPPNSGWSYEFWIDPYDFYWMKADYNPNVSKAQYTYDWYGWQCKTIPGTWDNLWSDKYERTAVTIESLWQARKGWYRIGHRATGHAAIANLSIAQQQKISAEWATDPIFASTEKYITDASCYIKCVDAFSEDNEYIKKSCKAKCASLNSKLIKKPLETYKDCAAWFDVDSCDQFSSGMASSAYTNKGKCGAYCSENQKVYWNTCSDSIEKAVYHAQILAGVKYQIFKKKSGLKNVVDVLDSKQGPVVLNNPSMPPWGMVFVAGRDNNVKTG